MRIVLGEELGHRLEQVLIPHSVGAEGGCVVSVRTHVLAQVDVLFMRYAAKVVIAFRRDEAIVVTADNLDAVSYTHLTLPTKA